MAVVPYLNDLRAGTKGGALAPDDAGETLKALGTSGPQQGRTLQALQLAVAAGMS
jgi:hypothetical protein